MKNKIIISSILTIAMCLSIIAGSTFALFTSESSVDVSVSSATVSVTATPTDLEMGSTLSAPLGTADATGNEITLEKFVPGDYATFKINVANNSDVSVKYKTVISISNDNGLVSGLVITIGDNVFTGITGDGELLATDWALIAPGEGNATVDVKISLPEDRGNEYQEKTCTLTYRVEAIQGNVVFETKVDTVEEFTEALSNVQPGDIINADGVTVDINMVGESAPGGIMAYSIPGDVTIKELTVTGAYRGGNYLMFEGTPDQEIVFEDCTFEPAAGSRVMALAFCGSDGGAQSVVYNNCTFKGPVITNFVDNTDGVATFNNCTFTKHTSGNHYVMAMGGTHVFNGCTFDYTGVTQSNMGTINAGSVNVCSESDGSYSTLVILNGCNLINCGKRTYGASSTLTVI